MPPSTISPHVGESCCPPPAAQTAASLPAPAVGQGEGIQAFAIWLELEGLLAVDELVSSSPDGTGFQERIDAMRPFMARRKATEICLELLQEYVACIS